MLAIIIIALIKIGLLVGGLLTGAAYLVLLERWVAAWVQDRKGPNRVGIPMTRIRLFGLGQPLADGMKFIFKEEFTPSHVDKFMFYVAPITMFIAALAVFAVIPFGSVLPADVGIAGIEKPIHLVVAPGIDVGLVYVAALGSIAVYGVLLGGWSSNNKYGFLGGLRASAQLIAYELPMAAALLGVALAAGSLRLDTIITQQAASGVWNVVAQPLGFAVFTVAAFAEAGRLPFDLSEAEQELVGGYHTEYSGIKLMMYLTSEFLHMMAAAFLITILYLGGWHFWGLTGSSDLISWPVAILRVLVLTAKVLGVIFVFMLVRWSWPRFRFDQLMGLAWNVMLPLGLVNAMMVAFWVEYGGQLAGRLGMPRGVAESIVGWVVLIATWLVLTIAVPASSDNRPRRGPSAVRSELDDLIREHPHSKQL
jgi:NADH-quinone oxidoreductase subunit H